MGTRILPRRMESPTRIKLRGALSSQRRFLAYSTQGSVKEDELALEEFYQRSLGKPFYVVVKESGSESYIANIVRDLKKENAYLLTPGGDVLNPLLRKYRLNFLEFVEGLRQYVYPTVHGHLCTLQKTTNDPQSVPPETLTEAKDSLRQLCGDLLWDRIAFSISGDAPRQFRERSETAEPRLILFTGAKTRIVGTEVPELIRINNLTSLRERTFEDEESRRYPPGSVVATVRATILSAPDPTNRPMARVEETWVFESCISDHTERNWILVRATSPETTMMLWAADFVMPRLSKWLVGRLDDN